MTSKKSRNTVMIVDGGHLRKLLQAPDAPSLSAKNIEWILRNCVEEEEYLQRIYYYDSENYTGPFRNPYPGFAKEKEYLALYGYEVRKRIKRGSKFRILNQPSPPIPSVDEANTVVWVANERTYNIFRELAQKDLFVVRRGRTIFKNWEKSDKPDKSEFYPNIQQKGVDMLIGLDIATIAITDQADRILFVANDTDFVPALKFARRTGRRVGVVIIDLPGGNPISPDLKMNSDYCREVPWPPGLTKSPEQPPTAIERAFQKNNAKDASPNNSAKPKTD